MVGFKENRREIVATSREEKSVDSCMYIEIRLRKDIPYWNRVDGTKDSAYGSTDVGYSKDTMHVAGVGERRRELRTYSQEWKERV